MATNNNNTNIESTTCPECKAPDSISTSRCFNKPVPCYHCEKLMCCTCGGKYALIPFDKSNPNKDEANRFDSKATSVVRTYCKPCFEEQSTLDFTKKYDVVVGGEDVTATTSSSSTSTGSDDTTITLIFVHGGGGSRQMFRPHAETLSLQYGYRCVLLDLPGHGTMADVPLTLDSCVETVQTVYNECNCDASRTMYVGASLGAYIGFYVLTKMSDQFAGSILMDCGQNVGPDASIQAKAGLLLLQCMSNSMSNKSLMEALVGVSLKSTAKYRIIESTFGAGMFFIQGRAQVECLRTVQPAQCIPQLKFPILFFNGSKDYRDNEQVWLSLCTNQAISKLHVYEGGDHFFTHDNRFVPDMLSRIHEFIVLCDVFANK